jgi:predicted DNA-binding transcriptional regulator AlpA
MPVAPDKPSEAPILLDVAAVSQLCGCSPRHVWRMVDAGQFPRPVPLGSKLKRWPRSGVLAWIEEQTASASR